MTAYLEYILFAAVCAAILAGFPVAFTLAGMSLLFAFLGAELGVFTLSQLGALPQRIYGLMTNEVLIAVPLFILMGVILERSRVAQDLLDAMAMWFAGIRGGLGLSVCVVGALMAASTGIVGATVVTMGLLSLPAMLRHGWDPRLATGTICAAGTLGQIIPPSIVLILLGTVMASAYQQAQRAMGVFSPETVAVGDLFAGAVLPGLVLVGLYIVYLLVVVRWRPSLAPLPERARLMAEAGTTNLWRHTLQALIPPLVLIVAVLGSILAGIATPTEAASVGAVGALLLAGYHHDRRRALPIYLGALGFVALVALTYAFELRFARAEAGLEAIAGFVLAGLACLAALYGCAVALVRTWRNGVLGQSVRYSARLTAMVFAIVIGATLFGLVFRGLGGDDSVRALLEAVPGGTAGSLLAVLGLMFVLGFFLDFIEITLVVVPIVAPGLLTMEVDPVWLAIMMAVVLQTTFLTPPFGFSLFYLRGVAPASVRTWDIYRGVVPFVALQLVALGLLALFPELATWLPEVLR